MPLILSATTGTGTPGDPIVRQPVDLRWLGADGSEWLFGKSGPVTLESISAIGVPPPHSRHTQQAPGVPGASQTGTQLQEKDVTLGVAVWSAGSSAGWVQSDTAWWDSLDRDVEGYLSARVLGQERRLPMRLADASDAYDVDPVEHCLGKYVIRMVASQPLWQSDPITRSWSDPATRDFYDPDPAVDGGVVHVMSAKTLGTATITNPGDEPTHPVWTVTGPCASVTVGVGSSVVEFAAALAEGDVLTIDTRPGHLSVRDALGSRATDVTAAKFAAIPAGAAVPLTIEAASTEPGFTVSAVLTPLYRRAW